MIVVTGGCGLIGSNVVKALNSRGRSDIIVVDNLENGRKFFNIASANILDYWDKDDFLKSIVNGDFDGKIDAVFHLGACSSTTEWDGRYLMRNNYQYSKSLLEWCQKHAVQLIYASSASVYGLGGGGFCEESVSDRPINMYAYSKFLFDQHVMSQLNALTSQVVGLRYFNVYGQGEQHKGRMVSTAFHFSEQIISSGKCKLFSGSHGFVDGGQIRDFVYVEDCALLNLWFFDRPDISGIFNAGTGQGVSFNEMAEAVIKSHRVINGVHGSIEYIPFPAELEGSYQSYTKADLTKLRSVGCDIRFTDVDSGVYSYLNSNKI